MKFQQDQASVDLYSLKVVDTAQGILNRLDLDMHSMRTRRYQTHFHLWDACSCKHPKDEICRSAF